MKTCLCQLIKLADDLDKKYLFREADIVDEIIKEAEIGPPEVEVMIAMKFMELVTQLQEQYPLEIILRKIKEQIENIGTKAVTKE